MDMQHLEQQGMQPACFLIKQGSRRFRFSAKYGEPYLGVRVIGRQIHACQSNQARARHIELALNQHCQIFLDLLGQTDVPVCTGGFMTVHNNLQCAGNFFDFKNFKLIANFDIGIATQGDTAIEAGLDFLDVILEALERIERTGPVHHVVTQQAHL